MLSPSHNQLLLQLLVGWPLFSLPPGYTPPQLENPTESGPSQPRLTQASVPRPNGTLVMQENVDITAGFPTPQGTVENPMLVYHSSNPSGPQREHIEPSLDGRPPVVVENEESKGKILALEERVKEMEGNTEFGFCYTLILDLKILIQIPLLFSNTFKFTVFSTVLQLHTLLFLS